MSNAHKLVPYVVSLKEALSITLEIESFLKGSESTSGRSPLEETKDFLNSIHVDGKPKPRVN